MRKSREQEPEGFAEFWAVWRPIARHTDGRGLAREAFRRHVLSGAEPQDIIDGAKCFIRTMKDRDREFVPLSATWINRESYLDLCDQQRAYDAAVQSAAVKRSDNVVQMSAQPVLPATHFLRQWKGGGS